MMNVLICDDMKPEIIRLERLLGDPDFDIETISFQNGYDALDYIRSGAVIDVCFLDIIMPEIDGVALAEELRNAGFTGEIVFLTTSNEYAAESYRVKAFSYLLKPIRPADLRCVLQELETARKTGDSDGVLIKASKVARLVPFREISHVEVIKHYVYFRLIDGEEIAIYATFAEIAQQLLCDRRFAQCHRSYIINMGDISRIDDKEITMRGGRKIPNSKSYPDVKKSFAKWMIGGNGK